MNRKANCCTVNGFFAVFMMYLLCITQASCNYFCHFSLFLTLVMTLSFKQLSDRKIS